LYTHNVHYTYKHIARSLREKDSEGERERAKVRPKQRIFLLLFSYISVLPIEAKTTVDNNKNNK